MCQTSGKQSRSMQQVLAARQLCGQDAAGQEWLVSAHQLTALPACPLACFLCVVQLVQRWSNPANRAEMWAAFAVSPRQPPCRCRAKVAC